MSCWMMRLARVDVLVVCRTRVDFVTRALWWCSMPKGKLFLFAVKGRVEDSDSDETRSPKGGGQAKAEAERMTQHAGSK